MKTFLMQTTRTLTLTGFNLVRAEEARDAEYERQDTAPRWGQVSETVDAREVVCAVTDDFDLDRFMADTRQGERPDITAQRQEKIRTVRQEPYPLRELLTFHLEDQPVMGTVFVTLNELQHTADLEELLSWKLSGSAALTKIEYSIESADETGLYIRASGDAAALIDSVTLEVERDRAAAEANVHTLKCNEQITLKHQPLYPVGQTVYLLHCEHWYPGEVVGHDHHVYLAHSLSFPGSSVLHPNEAWSFDAYHVVPREAREGVLR